MCNVWKLVKLNKTLVTYLPDDEMNEGRYPDKVFFWGVLFAILPNWSNEYYEAVLKKRTQMPKTINQTKVRML